MNDATRPLLLIDAYSQIYRGYYAVRGLTSPSGAPSNAIFAMSKLLMKLAKDFDGFDGAFVFDLGKSQARLALAPDYKANRPPMPEDLRAQTPAIREMIAAFGWPIVEAEGYEADDLIACIALANAGKRQVDIISSDKDLHQLVGPSVSMLVPDKDGGFARRGPAETLEKFEVPPDRIAELLALTGDSSDNIAGVEGVGPKTAASLIKEYGSVKGVMENLDKLKRPALREKLAASKELIERNLKMVRLGGIEPPDADWSEARFKRGELQKDKLLAMAEEFRLRSLSGELKGDAKPQDAAKTEKRDRADDRAEQLCLF